jgi:general secretion pathway protein C
MRLVALMLWSSLALADASLPSSGAGEIACEGHRCVMSREVWNRLLNGPPQARVVPFIGDGKARGFRIYAVAPGSLLARLLLRSGELIRSIDGADVTSPDAALDTYARIRNANRFSVEVERRGEPLTFVYEIRG